MFAGMFVSGALTGMLNDFLDSEYPHTDSPALTACRTRLAACPADSRLPLADWIALLHAIAGIDHRPALGLAIARHIAPRHAGVLGYIALSCDNLGEALVRFQRYDRLVYDGNPAAIHVHGEQVSISWGTEHGLPGQLADETAIAAFLTLVRRLVQAPINPSHVNFVNSAPCERAAYDTFFACPVSFGGRLSVVSFPQHYLNLPIVQGDAGLRVLLEAQADSLLAALPSNDRFEKNLKAALLRSLHEGQATLEAVATRLALSPRTLQRRLREHDLSFQQLLDRSRAELARTYLQQGNLSLADIALLLGYSEQSAFNRAYKRWTGHSPRQRPGH